MKRERGLKRSSFAWIVLILLSLFFLGCQEKKLIEDVSPSLDSEQIAIAEESTQILYVSTMDVPPWGFTSWSGAPKGLVIDTFNYIGEELNLTMVHRLVPFSRGMFDLETGDADLWIGFPNKDVEKSSVRIGNFALLNTIIVGVAGTEFNSLEDFHGKTVATLQGAQYDSLFLNDPEIVKYPTQNYRQSFQMLFTGRVDGVVGPEVGLYYILREMGRDRSQLGEPLYLESRDAYIFYSKQKIDPEIKSKIEDFTASKKYQDQIRIIFESYIN